MNIRVEHVPGEVQVILRGPEDSAELLRILALLEQDATRLWAWDEYRRMVAVPVRDIVWGEVVDEKVFIYTALEMYQTTLGLGMLESRWERLGLFRCAKSTLVNLNAIQALRSLAGNRIEATLKNGEKIVVSRRYAPLLRERIQDGG